MKFNMPLRLTPTLCATLRNCYYDKLLYFLIILAMGIFEIMGEFINPGPVGKVYLNDDDYNIRQKLIPIRFIVSLIIIGLMA